MSFLLHYIPQRAAPPAPFPGIFDAVRARGSTVWAVGVTEVALPYHDLPAYWNGTAWVVAYNTDTRAGEYFDVTLSPSYTWACDNARVWRRDAGGTWTLSDTASGTGGEPTSYFALTGASDTDIYAGGSYAGSATPPTRQLRHWTGAAWSDVAIAGSAGTYSFAANDLDLDPGGDCWYAGSGGPSGGPTVGKLGSISTGLVTITGVQQFISIWARTTGDQWAVARSGVNGLLVYRNTGGGFALLTGMPSLPADADAFQNHYLLAIHGTSASDVWAVGYYTTNGVPAYDRDGLLWHYNGTAWSATTRPALPGDCTRAQINDVVALASNDVWAVGQLARALTDQPLAYHWDGTLWSDASPTL